MNLGLNLSRLISVPDVGAIDTREHAKVALLGAMYGATQFRASFASPNACGMRFATVELTQAWDCSPVPAVELESKDFS